MEQVTSSDGAFIVYRRSGAGPPLLLVHGTTADHRSWSAVAPLLEPHFTLYAMDRRGRGESGDTADYGLEREVADIIAVIEAIGQPVNVLGHSYGALCCLEAALQTDAIARLILYEPGIHCLQRPTMLNTNSLFAKAFFSITQAIKHGIHAGLIRQSIEEACERFCAITKRPEQR